MQSGAQRLIWERFEVLPRDKQREVADFIEFLASRSDKSRTASSRPKQCWGKERFIGMWDDRSDMTDSSEWVRQQRRSEWGAVT